MAAAAIFNHAMTAAQAMQSEAAKPMDGSANGTNGTDTTNGSSGDSATISANDFLTLLVTEMQNQDPTANTDPNEYINQLVSVNSLEQLIDINQTLTTGLDGTSGNSGNGASGQIAAAGSGAGGASAAGATPMAPSATHGPRALSVSGLETIAGGDGAAQSPAAQHTPGNLSVPRVNPAGQRVAHALDGRMHGRLGEGSGIAMQ